jgi:hypothetical protein
MQLADKKHITMEICTRAQTDKNRQAQSEVVDVLFLRGAPGRSRHDLGAQRIGFFNPFYVYFVPFSRARRRKLLILLVGAAGFEPATSTV